MLGNKGNLPFAIAINIFDTWNIWRQACGINLESEIIFSF